MFDEMTKMSVSSWNIMIIQKNVVLWNTLRAWHVRLHDIEGARRVFQEMPERDAVSQNTMITGYVYVLAG